jgi:hypothetical protein
VYTVPIWGLWSIGALAALDNVHVVHDRGILLATHLGDVAYDTRHVPVQGQREAMSSALIAALQRCEAGIDVAQGGGKGQDVRGIVSQKGLC